MSGRREMIAGRGGGGVMDSWKDGYILLVVLVRTKCHLPCRLPDVRSLVMAGVVRYYCSCAHEDWRCSHSLHVGLWR